MQDGLIILDPWPRSAEQIFDTDQYRRLEAFGPVVSCDSRTEPSTFDSLLPDAIAILGQPALDRDRLSRASNLQVLINVEGNFYPNVDYSACFAAGITVLSIAPAFAVSVAEMTIGLALDLARAITPYDAAIRAGTELYGSRGGGGAMLLSRSTVGIIGYGGIGRAVRRLLRSFASEILVYDPWLPDGLLHDDDCTPTDLATLLATSDFVLVCAAATVENQQLLGRAELGSLRPGAVLVLVGRADVVDFAALIELVNAGHFRAAVDVFPKEPIPIDDPIRQSKLLLSSHRAGGTRAAMASAAEMILDDLGLILRGLPPMRLLPARRETIASVRSKPAQYR